MTTSESEIFRRYRRNRLLRTVLVAVIMLAATVGIVEVMLRAFDPFGVVYFFDLSENFYDNAIPDPRGYVLPAGEYQASHWSFRILPDHTRAVPDTDPTAPRKLVFIGDSVTFGYGVEDDETFVNLIARQFPAWHVINEAYPAWSIGNLENALAMHPDADKIYVLTIYNDLEEPYRTHEAKVRYSSYIELYAMVLKWVFFGYPMSSDEEIAQMEPAWRESITAIGSDPRVTFLTIDSTIDYEQRVFNLFPEKTVILTNFTGLVSLVDSHPNAASHAFLADQLLPVVSEALAALEAE